MSHHDQIFWPPPNFARLLIQRHGGIVVGWLLKLGRAAAMLAGVNDHASFDAFINVCFASKGFINMTMPRAIFSFADLDMNALEGQRTDSQGNSLMCSGIGSADRLFTLTSLLAHSNLPKNLGRDRYRRDGQAGLSSTALSSLILRDVFSRIHIWSKRERMWCFLSQERLGLKVILSNSKDRLVHAVPLVNRSFVPGCLFRRVQLAC